MELGKAKYKQGKENIKIKDGDNVVRILPPMGKLAKSGKWSAYYRIEWGYKDSRGKQKPFQSTRVINRDTKMVEVEDAAYVFRMQLINKRDELIKNKGSVEQIKKLGELLKQFNQEAKHHLNVIDLNGKIGLLKLGHKAFLSLKAEIEKLTTKGIDPLSIENGRFFNLFRNNPTGNFNDITTTASVYSENIQVIINGQSVIVKQDKAHTIDDAIISRLSSEAYELSELYPSPTNAQVERIVKEGPRAVDEILGSQSVAPSVSEEVVYDEEEEESTANNSSNVSSSTLNPTMMLKLNTPQPMAEQRVEQRAEAVKEPPVTSVTQQTVQPTVGQALTNQTNEDFLASLGLNK